MCHAVIFSMYVIMLSITKIIRCESNKSNHALVLTKRYARFIVNNINRRGIQMRKRILLKEEEISREIERRIEYEQLREGDKIPSERELAEEFGVQRGTVRCALEVLLNKGVIIKRPRQGHFVAPRRIEINLNNLRSIMKEIERVGICNKSIILSFEVINMSKKLSEITKLHEGTLCYQLLRMRYDNNGPISLERSYVISEHVPEMSKEDLEHQTLGPFLKNKYGIQLTSTHQRITQVYCGDMEAELLRISKGEPLIRYEGLIYDRKDRLIEYFDNLVLPDSIEFHIRDFA